MGRRWSPSAKFKKKNPTGLFTPTLLGLLQIPQQRQYIGGESYLPLTGRYGAEGVFAFGDIKIVVL